MEVSRDVQWQAMAILALWFIVGALVGWIVLRKPIARLREASRLILEAKVPDGDQIAQGFALQRSAERRMLFVFWAGAGVGLLGFFLRSEPVLRGEYWAPPLDGHWLISLAAGLAVIAFYLNSKIMRVGYSLRAVDTARKKIIESIDEVQVGKAEITERARAERDEHRYRENLGKPYELKYFELRNASIFRKLEWNFEPQMNVLLGRNGYGKSYLLRLLVGLLSYENDRLTKLLPEPTASQRLTLHLMQGETEGSIERGPATFNISQGRIPLLAIPDSRFVNRTRDSFGADESDSYTDLARYGAHHFLHDLPYDSTIQTVVTQMCIDVLDRGTRRGRPESPQIDLVSGVLHELSGEAFTIERINPVGSAKFAVMLDTDASPGRLIPLQQASQGTLSIIAITALIYQFLREVHKEAPESDVCAQRGIVLIDEIDAHLHPAWQRKMTALLRERFPNVQFILSAHSPLLVAGCGRGEVSVLRREADGLVVHQPQHDFVGVSPEVIYRNVFQIEGDDTAFLDLNAQVPRLPELKRELESLQLQPAAPATRQRKIDELTQTIESIESTRREHDKDLAIRTLEEENEQLRRQLNAARRTSGASSS